MQGADEERKTGRERKQQLGDVDGTLKPRTKKIEQFEWRVETRGGWGIH